MAIVNYLGGGPQGAQGPAGPAEYLHSVVNLTDAQIKTLGSAPVTLVSAGGVGTIIIPSLIIFRIDNAAAVYTAGSTTGVYLSTNALTTFNFTPLTADAGVKASWLQIATTTSTATTAAVNQALVLKVGNATDYTGGNAANKMSVEVYYKLVTAAPV